MGTKEIPDWKLWGKRDYFTTAELAALFCAERPTPELSGAAIEMMEFLKEKLATGLCRNIYHTGEDGLRVPSEEEKYECIHRDEDNFHGTEYRYRPDNIYHAIDRTGGINKSLNTRFVAPNCEFDRKTAENIAETLDLRPIFLFPEKKKTALSGSGKTDAKTLSHLLDDKQEWYSEELAIAVKAWIALFDTSKPLSTKKSSRQQIKEWLNNNYGKKYTGSTLERIITIINPNKKKKGGAPPTSISGK
jgi:hypothetical protein